MSATMINRSELERIKASILPPVEDNSRIERRKELKKKSEDRLKNWPNTLEALRLKKESFLKDREAEEEKKRQELDREEAEIRRQARLDAIRKANDLIYEQTDKMKLLKSQKLYADVIATRFEQTAEKQVVKQKHKEVESQYHQKTLEEVARLKAIEDEKVAKNKKLVEEIKAQRVEQLEEARKRREAVREAERQNGIELKEKAVASLEAERRELEERKRQAAADNMRMLKANADLRTIRQQLIEEEKRAEAERDAQVAGIEGRKVALKRLEKERFDRSQMARQRMIDKAVEQLAKQNSAADAVLEKQVQDQRDKEDRLFHEKQERQRREYEETVASRTAQVEARRAAEERQRREEAVLLEKWRKENEEAMQREKDKVRRAREETVALKATQKAEGEAARRKREEDRQREIEQTRFLQSIDISDESRFVELCQAEIERNIKLGKPVYTLLRALEYSAPPLLPAKTVPIDRQDPKGTARN